VRQHFFEESTLVYFLMNASVSDLIFFSSYFTTVGERGYIRVAQINPDDSEDSWGLFGILAEGIIATDAKQSDKVFTQDARRPTWWKVMVSLLTIFGFCILVLIGMYVYERCYRTAEQEN